MRNARNPTKHPEIIALYCILALQHYYPIIVIVRSCAYTWRFLTACGKNLWRPTSARTTVGENCFWPGHKPIFFLCHHSRPRNYQDKTLNLCLLTRNFVPKRHCWTYATSTCFNKQWTVVVSQQIHHVATIFIVCSLVPVSINLWYT